MIFNPSIVFVPSGSGRKAGTEEYIGIVGTCAISSSFVSFVIVITKPVLTEPHTHQHGLAPLNSVELLRLACTAALAMTNMP